MTVGDAVRNIVETLGITGEFKISFIEGVLRQLEADITKDVEQAWRETVIKAREARDDADFKNRELLVCLKDCGAALARFGYDSEQVRKVAELVKKHGGTEREHNPWTPNQDFPGKPVKQKCPHATEVAKDGKTFCGDCGFQLDGLK